MLDESIKPLWRKCDKFQNVDGTVGEALGTTPPISRLKHKLARGQSWRIEASEKALESVLNAFNYLLRGSSGPVECYHVPAPSPQ